ncbi:MAG: hypothetical protein GXO79_09000 [Chlorobi bacterium]|nr:hypothetical protein [Chlorobiota bacterium]
MKPRLKLSLSIFIIVLEITNITAQNNNSNKLIGSWLYTSQQGNISLIFKSENILIYDGSQAYYSLQQGVIIVQDEYGNAYYPYTLENNKLNITFPEGYMLTFIKNNASNVKRPSTEKTNNNENYNYLLSGKLCHWSGSSNYSSSYSNSLWAYFDGKGNFSYGSESSFSSGTGIAYGDDNSGENHGTYDVKGNIIILHFSDGSSGKATVNIQQDDGRITEIIYEGNIYATSLCD